MRVTIDRFEGDYAVCEKCDREMVNIEKNRLPPSAKEGDVLVIDDDSIAIDYGETEARRLDIRKASEDIWEQ